MLTLDEIRKRLADRRIDIVAERTGIHRNTLSAIRDGRTTNPSYETIYRLSEYFSE